MRRGRTEAEGSSERLAASNLGGENKVQEYSFPPLPPLFLFWGILLLAEEDQFSCQPLLPTLSSVSVSCKAALALHFAPLVLTQLHRKQLSPAHMRSAFSCSTSRKETTVSGSVVYADNHRDNLAGWSCPEKEWHLMLKALRQGIPNAAFCSKKLKSWNPFIPD